MSISLSIGLTLGNIRVAIGGIISRVWTFADAGDGTATLTLPTAYAQPFTFTDNGDGTGSITLPEDAVLPATVIQFDPSEIGADDFPTDISTGTILGEATTRTFALTGLVDGSEYRYVVLSEASPVFTSAILSPPVAAGGLPDVSFVEGTPITPIDVAADFTGSGITYALAPGSDGLVAGLTLSSAGQITGTPTITAPTSTIIVRGTNAGGFDDTAFGLTVTAAPVAGDGPVISLVTFDENTDISEVSTDTLNGNYHWARQNPGDADAVYDPATDTWSGTFAESGVIAVPATSPASFDIPETGTTGQNYKIRFVQESAAGEISNYLTINYTADNTAPVHSWALTSGDTLLGAVLTVDEVAQVSWVLTTSATVPSAAQIIAGQDDTGAAAVSSGQINPAGIGAQASFDITGLTNGTAYHIHSTQADTHGNVGVATATETPLISGLPVHVESATLINDTGFLSQFNSSLHGPGLTAVSGGADRYVLFKVTSVMGGTPADLSLATMTYGGVSCDLIVHSPASSGQPAALLFTLKEADIPAGTNETAIAFNVDVRSCIVHYELYSNVDQVTPIPANGTRNDFGNSTLEPFLGITIQESDSAIVGVACVPTSINTLNRVERRATDGTTLIGPIVTRASDYTTFSTGSATSDHFGVSFGYSGPPAGAERSYVVMNDDGDGAKNFAIVLAELNGA